jgi:hypothetical protein
MNLNQLSIERLVEGRLSGDEYRDLLKSLEEEPGAWRRCALAFLEEQALAREFGEIRRGIDAPISHPTQVEKKRQWDSQPATMLLTLIASVTVALFVGWSLHRAVSKIPQDAGFAGNIKDQPALGIGDGSHGSGPRHESWRPVGSVRLVLGGGDASGADEMQQVPVYEVADGVEDFLEAEDRPALGPEVVELMRQRGYDVVREQQYFPAALDDGRQLIVPVDNYRITPVSRTY